MTLLLNQLGATSGNPIKDDEDGYVLWKAQGGESWSRDATYLQMGGKITVWNGTEENIEICTEYGPTSIFCSTLQNPKDTITIKGTMYMSSGTAQLYVMIDGEKGPVHLPCSPVVVLGSPG